MQFPAQRCSYAEVPYGGRDPDGLCVLCPFQVQAVETRCFMSALSQVGHESIPLPDPSCRFLGVPWGHSPRCGVCLLWGPDLRLPPSWHMSAVQDPSKAWLATGSLLTVWWRMPSLGPRLSLALQLWLSPACLSAPGGGEGPVCNWLALLWDLLNPLFCEWARLRLRL